MVDVLSVSASLAIDGQENTSQQRSAGKRSRDNTISSSSKRRALACLSNHVDTITERQQQNTKTCFRLPSSQLAPPHTQSSNHYVTSLTSHLNTPGLASPMLVSSPSDLACTETVDHAEDDSLACCEQYVRDVFLYLREAEVWSCRVFPKPSKTAPSPPAQVRCQPKVGYMLKQPDITSSMRCVLVDWLVEVVDEFSLQSRTLYLAVSLIDRFLSRMSVLRGKLQLVGSTAMYIAAKIEEIYPPELSDFAYITDNTYTHQQIVRMEQLMLKALDYNLLAPASTCFLDHFLQAVSTERGDDSSLSTSIQHLTQYLCELALVHSDPFLKYLPSEIAASAVCLARHSLEQEAWPGSLQTCSGYSVSDIGHCLQDMHRMFAMATRHPQQAIRLKYCSEKFVRVATIAVPETLPM